MRYCPQCNNKYPEPNIFCLVDGERLVKNDPSAKTLIQNIDQPNKIPTVPDNFEFISEKIVLNVGEYYQLTPKLMSIRIVLNAVIKQHLPDVAGLNIERGDCVKVSVSMSGALLHCGPHIFPISVNEYLIPQKKFEEESDSLFSFMTNDRQIRFFRLFVEHINTHTKQVEFNVLYLYYNHIQ